MCRSILLAAFLAGIFLSGCAGSLPLPGGDDETNKSLYASEEELKLRVSQLKAGMNKSLTFALLGRNEHEFTRLDRPSVMTALYGGSGGGFDGTLEQQETGRMFLQSLEGYRLAYKFVDSELGFSSPIRIKTKKHGYNYTLTLIFQDGKLFDQPLLTGGVVEESSSKTFFEYLTPGFLISR